MGKSSSHNRPPIKLREARWSDYAFAERLYVESMRSLLMKLGAWNEKEVIGKFKPSFVPGQVQIISVNGVNAGWLQIADLEGEINLSQIHLEEEFRCLGIGTQLVRDLLNRASAQRKPVSLSVVHNNPAFTLYERLGFKVVGEDREKKHLRWDVD